MMAVASSAHTAPHHGRRRDGLGPLSQDGSTDWGGEEGREDADDGVSDAKGGGGEGGRATSPLSSARRGLLD